MITGLDFYPIPLFNFILKQNKMRIVNVIELQGGSVSHITSFCILEEQLSQDVVNDAEIEFKHILYEKTGIDKENMDKFVEDGCYEDVDTGYILTLTWSDVVI